ncbi:MAG: Flp pilus assembly complex ATPase component TadA [Candidatus Moranbacteria bacterium]|nr:Flp pilus assembly complex ATPase component TadA [Candidatus Moranbacteria bacterium]MBP6034425.1 Flp pilus assembly complex ATPase component TadA [Candidatus Moranbacteria bacterium]MBP7695708.1 Flp pilus assembly complex ATPase component TadA [Candidatus Moranbacteria bacterium]
MRIAAQQLKDFLLDSGLLSKEKIEEAIVKSAESKQDLGQYLLEAELLQEAELQKVYAYVLGIPFVDLVKETIPLEILQVVPEPIAKKSNIVSFEKDGNNLKVAMLNPEDLQTIDFIKKKTGLRIIPCLTTRESIQTALRQYEKSLKAEFGDILTGEVKPGDLKKDEENAEALAAGLPIIRIVDTLLKHAILQSASDIHIEPDEKEVHVRYRIDGVLHDAMTLPKDTAAGIVARIKVLSNLKLDEHRVPQDGRFKIEKDEYKISFRVSLLPVFDGEKVVMRLLDETSKGLTLEKMGLNGKALESVHREINKPNGMILVTGPTGSGKTTTLYTTMDILNTPEVNVSTVEDPVEYRMPRVNQTQINPKVGMTFAAGLRSLLRQDPDIIMVGEIRDQETLEIAMHAAMTGHLVLSTLHTNSAAATLPRMLDMGAEPFLIASTVNVIIAQRLVRKLCAECRKPYQLDEKQMEALSKSYDIDQIFKTLQTTPETAKIVGSAKSMRDLTFYMNGGCDQCGGEGYRGRLGIYEVLEMETNIRKLVTQAATTEDLENMARQENGMCSMVEDGFMKVVNGLTTIEEIMRATKE